MATTGRNIFPSPRYRRNLKVSYSDDDDSDDRAYSSGKPSGSQFVLKKKLDTAEINDDSSSQEEGDENDNYNHKYDDSSVGTDLYKDQADRKKLSSLTELGREMILGARATKSSEILKKRKSQDRKGSPPKRPIRGMHLKAERAGALAQLAKRKRDAACRAFTATNFSQPNRTEIRSENDEEESPGDGGMMTDSGKDNMLSESAVPTFEDIMEITIDRTKLAKQYMEPFFDELIAGCFVRVRIGESWSGPAYRFCMVRNVDATNPDRPYTFENKTTYKYLNLVWGNERSAARWQMAVVSNYSPSREEFDQWFREVQRYRGRMPTKQEVLEKREAIRKACSFVCPAATVKQMLQEKRSASWTPLKIAKEKDHLRRELEMMKGDEAEVERIKARLQELEAAACQVQEKDKKAIKLAEMNRKNRIENLKIASQVKPVNTSLKSGDAGYDPFCRRWTRPRNYFMASSNGGAAAALADNGEGRVSAESMVAAATAAPEAAAGMSKLVETSAPTDQGSEPNMLHRFELSISLAMLEKFGGPEGAFAGYMARKQRTEAKIGCKIPEDDERRHPLTLTVSNYKKRRGLL